MDSANRRGRRMMTAAFTGAVAVNAWLALGWPYHHGPDSQSYILYYADFLNSYAVAPFIMACRTPLAPLPQGALLDLGGPWLALAFFTVAGGFSAMAVVYVARLWGDTAAWVCLAGFLLLFGWHIELHYTGSDGPFAIALLLCAAALRWAMEGNGAARWLALGVCIGVVILTRPVGQFLAALAVVPWLLPGDIRGRSLKSACLVLGVAALTAPLVIHNGLRYDYYGLARNQNIYISWKMLDRPFIYLVDPSNGPVSKALYSLVEKNEYAFDRGEFKTKLRNIMERGKIHEVWYMVDALLGWEHNHRIMRGFAMEAIQRYPHEYRNMVTIQLKEMIKFKAELPEPPGLHGNNENIGPVDDKLLPQAVSPMGIYELPSQSNRGRYHSFLPSPFTQRASDEVVIRTLRKRDELMGKLDGAKGYEWAVHITENLNLFGAVPLYAIWFFSILHVFGRTRERVILGLTMALLPLAGIGTTVMFNSPLYRYRLPYEPLIMMSGVLALADLKFYFQWVKKTVFSKVFI